MRFAIAPLRLSQLVSIIFVSSRLTLAKPNLHPSLKAGFTFNELFARWDCPGTACGWSGQKCCGAGTACYTNSLDQADCTTTAAAAATDGGGYWQLYTTTYVQTDLQTITAVMSSFVGGTTSAPSVSCHYALGETPCGSICCASNQYCAQYGQCAPAPGGGSSGYYSSYTPGAPIRPTSSGITVVTATKSPTTTVPFQPPVATGANITVTAEHHSSGLSGGAIAGIVIGVLLGLLLLALLCFYCCVKGLIDGLLACFGLGRGKKRRVEIDEYERRSHHTSRTGGRTFFGVARPPARVQREDKRKSEGRTILGIGAGLAALWAILGLKRRHENRKKQEEKYSEYSYSSDYYTSASSASSDRRTRDARESHRSVSRR